MTSVHLRDWKKFQVFSGCRSKYHKHLWLGSWPPGWPSLARKYSSPPSLGLSCGISTVPWELFNGRLIGIETRQRSERQRETGKLEVLISKALLPGPGFSRSVLFSSDRTRGSSNSYLWKDRIQANQIGFYGEWVHYVHMILLTYYFNSSFESLLSPVPYESSLWVTIS